MHPRPSLPFGRHGEDARSFGATKKEKRGSKKRNFKIENSSFKEEENSTSKKTIRILQKRNLKTEFKKSIFFGFYQRFITTYLQKAKNEIKSNIWTLISQRKSTLRKDNSKV